MFTLITITRITTAAPTTRNTQKIAKAIAKTGKNIVPLYVKNVGTVTQPEYQLVHPTREQLETLAAVRAAKAANPLHCNAYCLVVGREEVEGVCHAEEDVMDQLNILTEEPATEGATENPVVTQRTLQIAQAIATMPTAQKEKAIATLPTTARRLVSMFEAKLNRGDIAGAISIAIAEADSAIEMAQSATTSIKEKQQQQDAIASRALAKYPLL